MDMNEKEYSPMLQETLRTPSIMKNYFGHLNKVTRMALSHEDILESRSIIITGSGDSYFAGIATKYAFEKYAGMPTTASPGMEVSRFLLSKNTNMDYRNTMVIGVSVSGEISRSVEALLRANQLDALSVAVTGSKSSRIGEAAHKVIEVPKIPKIQTDFHVPGTWSFTLSMMALYLLAFHFAEVKDRLLVEEVNKLGQDLLNINNQVDEVINNVNHRIAGLATQWKKADKFLFLGSGPNFSTALYSAAKIVEATGKFAVGLDIEEYAHLYHFCHDQDIPIMVFLPEGKATSRAIELIQLMRKYNRRLMVITTENSSLKESEDVIHIQESMDEITSPIIFSIVSNLLAAYLRDLNGVPYFNGFPPDPSPNGNTIVSSQIETLD